MDGKTIAAAITIMAVQGWGLMVIGANHEAMKEMRRRIDDLEAQASKTAGDFAAVKAAQSVAFAVADAMATFTRWKVQNVEATYQSGSGEQGTAPHS